MNLLLMQDNSLIDLLKILLLMLGHLLIDQVLAIILDLLEHTLKDRG